MPPSKITSKNLTYESAPPPFLAALRAQVSGATGPDPILAAQRRSAKKRSSSEEADDVPLVVDESGNVVRDLEVDKDGVVVKDSQSQADPDASEGAPGKDAAKTSDKAVLGGRKRKVGKVIGESADQPDEKDVKAKVEKDSEDKSKDRKPKKKPKKIKLSFDDEEG